MAFVKNVEKSIRGIEELDVLIKHADGRDMRGDRAGIAVYDFSRKAKGTMTVSAWKEQRFYPKYPGFDVDVLDGYGNPVVAGNTLLSTVRDSYAES